MPESSGPLLSLVHVEKLYPGHPPVGALRGVDLHLAAGEFVALMGPSGCGKSTLLHLAGAMDRPSAGSVRFEQRDLSRASDDELTRLRRERIGFVFQFFNLLPTLTVRENIALPLRLAGVAAGDAGARAAVMAERVGLSPRLDHFPQQLSGGEMQRTAIARAIVHQPRLLVADEPTGNLDSANGAKVLELLQALNRDTGVAILLATHAADVAAVAHRTIHMRDGVAVRVEHGTAAGGAARVVV
ncbi:MAG: ABC transporter ATP-binding protein [Acidobacteria bacterium]|nr:ABC transporter ATP-binding protein [Acidobacteriota bacterium]